MSNQPEVQCRNCGFLHGTARRGATREDVYFDPDELRKVTNLAPDEWRKKKADLVDEITDQDFRLTSYVYLSRGEATECVNDFETTPAGNY